MCSTTTLRSMCKSLKSLRKFGSGFALSFWVERLKGRKNRGVRETCSYGVEWRKSLILLRKEAGRTVLFVSFAKSLKSLDIFAGNSGQGSASL